MVELKNADAKEAGNLNLPLAKKERVGPEADVFPARRNNHRRAPQKGVGGSASTSKAASPEKTSVNRPAAQQEKAEKPAKPSVAAAPAAPARTRGRRGGKGAATQRRSPIVRVESEKEHERNDGIGGIMKLKISNARPRLVYTRLARLFLAGYDNRSEPLVTVEPVDKVEIAALGAAVNSAIYIADHLVKSGVATEVRTLTEFTPIEHADGVTRGAPRIVLLLKRVDTWKPEEDPLLLKTRSFRTKVLKLEDLPPRGRRGGQRRAAGEGEEQDEEDEEEDEEEEGAEDSGEEAPVGRSEVENR